VYHCPADKGDALYPNIKNICWDAWGNSYLMPWAVERYRVKFCGGDSTLPASNPMSKPIKTGRIGVKPTTKVILSDWPWFGDRDINNARSVWHNDRGKAVFPTLFGDSHVQNFRFPGNRQSYDDGRAGDPFYTDPKFPFINWW
jgi:hypothetical protein